MVHWLFFVISYHFYNKRRLTIEKIRSIVEKIIKKGKTQMDTEPGEKNNNNK